MLTTSFPAGPLPPLIVQHYPLQITIADGEAAAYYRTRTTGLVADPRSLQPSGDGDGGGQGVPARRTWSGLGGFPGKAMLSKFAAPARTHLLDLYKSKVARPGCCQLVHRG